MRAVVATITPVLAGSSKAGYDEVHLNVDQLLSMQCRWLFMNRCRDLLLDEGIYISALSDFSDT